MIKRVGIEIEPRRTTEGAGVSDRDKIDFKTINPHSQTTFVDLHYFGTGLHNYFKFRHSIIPPNILLKLFVCFITSVGFPPPKKSACARHDVSASMQRYGGGQCPGYWTITYPSCNAETDWPKLHHEESKSCVGTCGKDKRGSGTWLTEHFLALCTRNSQEMLPKKAKDVAV